jgi:hypothetical protein
MYATLSRLARAYTFKGHEMSEELQNDEYVEETEAEDVQTEETNESESSDLATDSDGEHENQPDDETIAKEKREAATNEAFNRQHRKYQDEKRRADQLQNQLAQYAPKNEAPPVLDSPDPFDDDYDTKQKAYIESVRQAERYNYQQEQSSYFESQQQADKQQKMQTELNTKAESYTGRAKEFGIKPEELQQAGQMVASYGLSDDLAMFILDDEQGPLITRHLSTNHADAEKIAGMTSMQAAMYIERTVKPKVAALKKKQTNTPNPATKISGGGGDKDAGRYKHSGNAKFE